MPSEWDRYIGWAKRIYALPNFDSDERDYKLDYFSRLRPVEHRTSSLRSPVACATFAP